MNSPAEEEPSRIFLLTELVAALNVEVDDTIADPRYFGSCHLPALADGERLSNRQWICTFFTTNDNGESCGGERHDDGGIHNQINGWLCDSECHRVGGARALSVGATCFGDHGGKRELGSNDTVGIRFPAGGRTFAFRPRAARISREIQEHFTQHIVAVAAVNELTLGESDPPDFESYGMWLSSDSPRVIDREDCSECL